MCEFFKKYFDWFIIIAGVFALVYNLFRDDCFSKGLCIAAALLWIWYIANATILWFCNRPKFDWHMRYGHFMRKVIVVVVLSPMAIATLYLCLGNNYSTKNIVYDDNLYTFSPIDTDTLGTVSVELLKDSLYHKTHNLTIIKDSLVVQQNKISPRSVGEQKDPSMFWAVYYHFIDPGNQHMTTSRSGRGWSGLIAILGVFLLNGLLVSSIVNLIESRREKWLKGEVKYGITLGRKPHYVIVGGNNVVAGIVRQIFEKEEMPANQKENADAEGNKKDTNASKIEYIVIQTAREVESFRRELFSTLSPKEQQRIIIYYGNRTSSVDIADLCVKKASEVYILGEDARGDDRESYHDTMNMECLRLLSDALGGCSKFHKDNKLSCRVMFEYQTSFNILQVTDIDGDKIDFKPFNYYEMWAQKVLVCKALNSNEQHTYLPLEGFNGIHAGDKKFVHMVVVGMSRMGTAMAIEAAHLAHFPNFESGKIRTRITFIDAEMEQNKLFFMGRFKEMFAVARYRDITTATLGMYADEKTYKWNNPLEDVTLRSPYYGDYLGKDFVDIEWEFINGSVENPNIQQYLSDAASNADAKLTIAICLPENSKAIAAAAYMPDSVYASKSTQQVLVYQRLNNELVKQVNLSKRYEGKLQAFGMVRECYDSSLINISDVLSNDVDNAYKQYDWKAKIQRYKDRGLIEDDYQSLSDYIYRENTAENKAFIKQLCDEWMKVHVAESQYKRVEAQLKVLHKQLEVYKKPAEYTAQAGGKSKTAKMWSNQYNVLSMWTKYRCVTMDGKPFDPMKYDFTEEMLAVLSKVEHNRWVVEQLLLRYRPMTIEEQSASKIENLYASAFTKSEWKKKFVHLDICSNDVLDKIDFNISQLDRELIKVLPQAYRAYQSTSEQ